MGRASPTQGNQHTNDLKDEKLTRANNGDPEHWWREPLAGLLAIAVSCTDIWYFGKEKGLSGPLDELVLLTGITLVAGVRNLFGTRTQISSSDLAAANERQKSLLGALNRIEEKLSK